MVTSEMPSLGSFQSEATWSGMSRRMIWSVVHFTVATVGMPSRW